MMPAKLTFPQTVRRLYGFIRFIVQRALALNMTQVASSLTFTTLLAIIPLFTVTLMVISAFPVFADFNNRFKSVLLSTLVPSYADKISVYLEQFVHNVGNLTAFGLIALGVTALLLLRTIEEAFNAIWRVRTPRSLPQQLLVYWTVLTLGPLLLGGGLSVWRLFYASFGTRADWPFVARLLETFSSLGFTAMILWLLYRVVPNRSVPARHALVGALSTAVVIEIGRYSFAYYVDSMASYQLLYGAFASLPVFLLWLYCLWLVVLGGAILTSSLSYWRGEAWLRPDDARRNFQDTIELLLLLHKGQQEGRAVNLYQMRQRIRAGFDQLGMLLEMLAKHAYVQQGRDGWVLKRGADHIQLSDVLRLFISDRADDQLNQIEAAINAFLQPIFASLDISLQAFAEQTALTEISLPATPEPDPELPPEDAE